MSLVCEAMRKDPLEVVRQLRSQGFDLRQNWLTQLHGILGAARGQHAPTLKVCKQGLLGIVVTGVLLILDLIWTLVGIVPLLHALLCRSPLLPLLTCTGLITLRLSIVGKATFHVVFVLVQLKAKMPSM